MNKIKIDSIAYMTYPALAYHAVGEFLGPAFRIGKDIKTSRMIGRDRWQSKRLPKRRF